MRLRNEDEEKTIIIEAFIVCGALVAMCIIIILAIIFG